MTGNPYRFFAAHYWRKAHGMDSSSFLEKCLHLTTDVRGVLHVGAHAGQEAGLYAQRGFDRVTWIEANPELEARLSERVLPLGHRVIMQAVGSHYGTTKFNVTTNDGESSSLRDLGLHAEVWPNIGVAKQIDVTVRTLDWLHSSHDFTGHNFWVLDVQGCEADVLRGAACCLGLADYVLCEVSDQPLYKGGATIDDIDRMLPSFTAIYGWRSEGGIGEVLYKRIRRTGRELMRAA